MVQSVSSYITAICRNLRALEHSRTELSATVGRQQRCTARGGAGDEGSPKFTDSPLGFPSCGSVV